MIRASIACIIQGLKRTKGQTLAIKKAGSVWQKITSVIVITKKRSKE
jgi:hypothetical protein